MKSSAWVVLGVAGLAAACGLMVSGCGSLPDPGNDTILVGRPEVFTRERLISQRLGQRDWLKKQLEKDEDDAFQGYRDIRTFSAFLADVKATIAPTGGSAAKSGQSELAGAVPSNEAATKEDLEKALDSLRTDLGAEMEKTNAALLKELKDGTGTADHALYKKDEEPEVPGHGTEATEAKLSRYDRLLDNLAYRNAVQAALNEQELDDTHDVRGMTLYTLKFDVTLNPDRETDSIACVDVRIEDDKDNDKDGNRDEDKDEDEDEKVLYEDWLRALQRRMQDETIWLQSRLPFMSGEERIVFVDGISQAQQWRDDLNESLEIAEGRLRNLLGPVLEKVDPTRKAFIFSDPDELKRTIDHLRKSGVTEGQVATLREAIKALEDERFHAKMRKVLNDAFPFVTLIAEPVEGLRSSEDRIAVNLTVSLWVMAQYKSALGELFEFDDSFVIPTHPGSEHYVPMLKFSNPEGEQAFKKGLDKIRSKHCAYVYSVEPKEHVQNISEVAAAERLMSYVATAKAVLPQSGTDIDATTQYLTRSQERLQAILRKPLVVGFEKSKNEFGWLFGPKFKIAGDEPAFAHTPVQRTVRASVVVPAWWSSMKLTVTRSWRDNSNSWRWPSLERTEADNCNANCEPLTVSLTPDLDALTNALMQSEGIWGRLPTLAVPDDPEGSACFVITAPTRKTEKQKLVIRGRALWRNPRVFVGQQEATAVDVLPDMGGLVATFTELRMPPEARDGGLLDLKVATSTGMAVLRKSVRVLKSETPTPVGVPPFARLAKPKAGEELDAKEPYVIFELPVGLPEQYGELLLKVVQDDQETEYFDTKILPVEQRIRADITRALPSKPAILKIDLVVKLKAYDDDTKAVTVLTEDSRRTVVYVPPEEDIAPVLKGKFSKDKTTIEVVFKPNGETENQLRIESEQHYKVLRELYPLVVNDLENSKALLELSTNGVSPKTFPVCVKESEQSWLVNSTALKPGDPREPGKTVTFTKARLVGKTGQGSGIELTLGEDVKGVAFSRESEEKPSAASKD